MPNALPMPLTAKSGKANNPALNPQVPCLIKPVTGSLTASSGPLARGSRATGAPSARPTGPLAVPKRSTKRP